MSAAFTPGPWEVLDHEGVHVLAEGGLTIATVAHQLDYAGIEGRAQIQNASLIAAAPDLLAAALRLEQRIAYYASMAEADQPNIEQWAYTDASSDVAELRAAIAKATGGA